MFTFNILRSYGALEPLPRYSTEKSSSAQLGLSGLDQGELLKYIKSPHYKSYAPSRDYQRRFWKEIISLLEDLDEEVDDRIYDTYVGLLGNPINVEGVNSTGLEVRYRFH